MVRCPKCRCRFQVRRRKRRRGSRVTLFNDPLLVSGVLNLLEGAFEFLSSSPPARPEEVKDADFKVLSPPRIEGPRP